MLSRATFQPLRMHREPLIHKRRCAALRAHCAARFVALPPSDSLAVPHAKKRPDAFRVAGTERPCKAAGTRKSLHYTNVSMSSIGCWRQVTGLFRQIFGTRDAAGHRFVALSRERMGVVGRHVRMATVVVRSLHRHCDERPGQYDWIDRERPLEETRVDRNAVRLAHPHRNRVPAMPDFVARRETELRALWRAHPDPRIRRLILDSVTPRKSLPTAVEWSHCADGSTADSATCGAA